MTVTIDVTVGGVDANSYATLVEATAWFNTQLRATAWTEDADSDDDRRRALIMATRLLDENVDWEGDPATETQALQWPRSGLLDSVGAEISEDEIPDAIKNAEAELAKYLLAGDRTAELSSDGIKSLDVGSVSIEFKEFGGPARKPIPDAVFQMIARWGALKYERSNQAKLVRA